MMYLLDSGLTVIQRDVIVTVVLRRDVVGDWRFENLMSDKQSTGIIILYLSHHF